METAMFTFRINPATKTGEIIKDGQLVETCLVRDIPARLTLLRAGVTADAAATKRRKAA